MATEALNQGYPVYGLEEGWSTSWVYVFPKGVSMRSVETQLRQEASLVTKPRVEAA